MINGYKNGMPDIMRQGVVDCRIAFEGGYLYFVRFSYLGGVCLHFFPSFERAINSPRFENHVYMLAVEAGILIVPPVERFHTGQVQLAL